jgi:uncharacterized membrane protein YeaQ/YmgE (transglycosylase-associated protein family)
MAIEALIIWLVIGAIAGWLADMLVMGYGFGLLGNIDTYSVLAWGYTGR